MIGIILLFVGGWIVAKILAKRRNSEKVKQRLALASTGSEKLT
ncbi:MAG: hypothetical protein [Olavius algarvensis Delta 4 endosymbiont]|nr:MAG: hypothetical protein [Olavius algarvensis Delta 4 endosymbiont]